MIIDPYTWSTVKIVAIKQIATDTKAIYVERPMGYTFRAGQYAVVRVTLPNGEQRIRQYSFSSSPQSEEHLEMLIQKEPSGEVSGWFCKQAVVHDEVEISQALGGFVLNDIARPTILIAGKIGVAPYLSMLREGSHPALSLIYSVRSKDQICYKTELSKYNAGILITNAHGRLTPETLAPFVPNKPVFYLCGSKQFVDDVTEMLVSVKIPMKDIYRELFTLQ